MKSTYDLAVEGMPERIRLAREIRGLFKPADCYHPKYHKFRPDPEEQIADAFNKKVDSAEYWCNRTYFSRLYQSLCDAKITQGDIQTVWGSPYISAAINWDKLPNNRQQAIRSQHPEIDSIAKNISCARNDFAFVLSKTTPDTHRFVNEFAIPMTALANQPKPSPLADTARRVISATVDVCHKYNDFTDRAWEIGWLHSVFDDDTLLNETERQQFKAWVIDREMREKQHGFVEVFNAVLNVAEITNVIPSAKLMSMPKLACVQRLEFRRAFGKLSYDPKLMESILAKTAKDVKKLHVKTGVKFDKNGFPVFGKLVSVDVKISGDLTNMTSQAHQQEATKVLRDLINSGKIRKDMFSPKELEKIQKGEAKFSKRFTWHHHQEMGRMQLVPSDVHSKVHHIGGNAIWGKKKK